MDRRSRAESGPVEEVILTANVATVIPPEPVASLGDVDLSPGRFQHVEPSTRGSVLPGDQLVVQVKVDKVRRGIWFYNCIASVDGQTVVSADITCAPGAQI